MQVAFGIILFDIKSAMIIFFLITVASCPIEQHTLSNKPHTVLTHFSLSQSAIQYDQEQPVESNLTEFASSTI